VVHARIADDQQSTVLRLRKQRDARLKNCNARPLSADQRARYIEAVLRQQLMQRKPGRPAREHWRKTPPDLVGVSIAKRGKRRINLTAPPTACDDGAKLGVRRRPNGQLHAVVRVHGELLDLMQRLSARAIEFTEHRMHAARIVADDAAERAATM